MILREVLWVENRDKVEISRYTKCIVEVEGVSNVPKGTRIVCVFVLKFWFFFFKINKTVKKPYPNGLGLVIVSCASVAFWKAVKSLRRDS